MPHFRWFLVLFTFSAAGLSADFASVLTDRYAPLVGREFHIFLGEVGDRDLQAPEALPVWIFDGAEPADTPVRDGQREVAFRFHSTESPETAKVYLARVNAADAAPDRTGGSLVLEPRMDLWFPERVRDSRMACLVSQFAVYAAIENRLAVLTQRLSQNLPQYQTSRPSLWGRFQLALPGAPDAALDNNRDLLEQMGTAVAGEDLWVRLEFAVRPGDTRSLRQWLSAQPGYRPLDAASGLFVYQSADRDTVVQLADQGTLLRLNVIDYAQWVLDRAFLEHKITQYER